MNNAINYFLFEHDEKTGKKIVDESGRSILRKEFYMDGLNCDPMSFDKECEDTKSHHEEAAGYNYRSTDKSMNTFKKTVMDRCQQEGLHQIDLHMQGSFGHSQQSDPLYRTVLCK